MSNNEETKPINAGEGHVHAGIPNEVLDGIVNPEPVKAKTVDKSAFVSTGVTFERPVLEPLTDEVKVEYPAHLFRQTDTEIADTISGFKNIDPSIGVEGKRWMAAVRGAQKMRVSKGLQEKSLNDENTDWRQYVQAGGYRAYSREMQSQLLDRNISGIRAINHLRHVMFMGEDREVPLMASGFYMMLRAVPDTELSNLETLVLSEKEEIGRLTGGAGLSATSVYLVDHVANMIINNMVSTNVEVTNPGELLDLILVTDIQALSLGQAQSIFPKGYPIEVPCTKNYEVCQHVDRYTLGLRYMAVHDNRKLTDLQKVQMSDPDRKITKKDVIKYQEEGPVKVSKVVSVHNGALRIDFRTPTLRQYINDGRAWIDGISGMVDTILSDDMDERQRKFAIEDQARLTTLRQYAHFVKSITIVPKNGVESTITDRETLLDNLNDLSADDEVLKAIVDGVRDHIEAATVTVVGVPKTPCPKCEADVVLSEDDKLHPRIIPVDALNLFFTLLSLKLSKRQATKLQDI
jgi:hypothetical protein